LIEIDLCTETALEIGPPIRRFRRTNVFFDCSMSRRLFDVTHTAVSDGITSGEHPEMATQTGRVEKRIRLEVPMQISRLETPGLTDLPEKTTTGNVSSHGVRVLTKRALPPQERLLVTSPISSEELIRARVVYCQPLAEGVFGVGLQFEKGEATALKVSSQPDIGGPGGAG
jgi:hypothetical protein